MANKPKKRLSEKMELSLEDIRNSLAHIEQWCRFLQEALEHYDCEKDKIVVKMTKGGPIQPKVDDCPPPEEDEWDFSKKNRREEADVERAVSPAHKPKKPKK